ncbi:uncharacterized protein FOBCDRAFT_241270 [Fusarium oxysporum Fo47]|uniref:uncharacterized protein n=1 Tax=Fusarium oxysporum Fo47 TaxID=660027 RepID=UPI002869D626|nr:uncharacterized protein FOBCDRAFT_241270 [Fusarium oxysporum Fo47]WJG35579.1 hypothetical protein FOBCDRAFT_241270 [Fusarium oxysporum Fo47]
MSFGYGVGDVIAVLGHSSRAKLDILRGTLERILSLEPECDAERETLEQIRAIVIYCAQPLQSMADKMRTKETTDVQELRQTVVSQMAAINVLLILQQQRLTLQFQATCTAQSMAIEKHAIAMAGHASDILNIASKTQTAIGALEVSTGMRAKTYSEHINEIYESLKAMERNMRHMTLKSERGTAVVHHQANFITRHAKTLFHLMQDIKRLFFLCISLPKNNARQLTSKHIISAIEVIPLHLTLDIVRLNDVHGESWALPLQTCRTWESFKEILQFVVYANERPGAKCITHNLFATAQAKTGKKVDQETWETMIEPGFHLEQAVVLKVDHWSRRCLDPKYTGTLLDHALEFETRQVCADVGLVKLLYLEVFSSGNPVQEARDLLENCLNALTKTVERNAHIWEPCCNGQHADAADAFYKCLERKPELSSDMKDELLGGTLIHEMVDSPLDGEHGW